MSNFRKALFVIPMLLILVACQAAPKPTEPVSPSDTSSDGQAAVPAGNVFNPSAPPADSWQDIPVMPKAIAGEEAEGMYGYKIDALPDDIIAYYRKRLPPFKWTESHYEPYEEDIGVIVFTRGVQTLTVVIYDANGLMLVLLQLQ